VIEYFEIQILVWAVSNKSDHLFTGINNNHLKMLSTQLNQSGI